MHLCHCFFHCSKQFWNSCKVIVFRASFVFSPHLLYILKTLSFKVPIHSWKQKKIAGCQVRGVRGVRSRCHPVFREKLSHTQCCVGGSEERISQQLVSCEVLLLKFVDISSTKLQSMLPTRRLFDDHQTLSHREFF